MAIAGSAIGRYPLKRADVCRLPIYSIARSFRVRERAWLQKTTRARCKDLLTAEKRPRTDPWKILEIALNWAKNEQ